MVIVGLSAFLWGALLATIICMVSFHEGIGWNLGLVVWAGVTLFGLVGLSS